MPGIIDGQAWLVQRRQFLHEELAKSPGEERRGVLETELAAVELELAAIRRHRWRWLMWGTRAPN